jgi:hypothetical protein
MIKWKNLQKGDMKIIHEIAIRANGLTKVSIKEYDMDIAACHISGNPLNLEGLLLADDYNFFHDVWGIHENIDKETGVLKNLFYPRYSNNACPKKRAFGYCFNLFDDCPNCPEPYFSACRNVKEQENVV